LLALHIFTLHEARRKIGVYHLFAFPGAYF